MKEPKAKVIWKKDIQRIRETMWKLNRIRLEGRFGWFRIKHKVVLKREELKFLAWELWFVLEKREPLSMAEEIDYAEA